MELPPKVEVSYCSLPLQCTAEGPRRKAGAKSSPKEGVAHPGKGVGQGTPCQNSVCRRFRWIPGDTEKVLEKAICGDLLNQQTTPGSENLAQQKKLEGGEVSRGQPALADTNLTLPWSPLPAVPTGFLLSPSISHSIFLLLPKVVSRKRK